MNKQSLSDLIATGNPGDTFGHTENEGVEHATLLKVEDDEYGRKHVIFARTKLFTTDEGHGGAHSFCTAVTSCDRQRTLARDVEYSLFYTDGQKTLPSLDEAARMNSEYVTSLNDD